jgi:hypothetical protein
MSLAGSTAPVGVSAPGVGCSQEYGLSSYIVGRTASTARLQHTARQRLYILAVLVIALAMACNGTCVFFGSLYAQSGPCLCLWHSLVASLVCRW